MVLPVPIKIVQENGKTDSIQLPVEIWQRGGEWTFHYPSTTTIKTVTIDPNHDYPDINPDNNTFSGAPLKKVPQGVTANDVINNYLKAIGGKDRIQAIKDFTYNAKGTVQGQALELVQKYKAPNDFLLTITLPASNTVIQKELVKGDSVSLMAMGNEQPLDEKTKQRIKAAAMPVPEIQYEASVKEITLQPTMAQVDGKDAYVLELSNEEDASTKEYFDAETGLKLKKEIASPSGPQTTSYSDYKEVNGVKFPYSMTVSSQVDIPFKVTDIKINSGLKDDDFK
jgi:outer membrane lipoprotein-sorting protein